VSPATPKAPPTASASARSRSATIVSALLFGLYYLNYVNGWIGVGMLDWASPPE
jgi:predicted secreted protein